MEDSSFCFAFNFCQMEAMFLRFESIFFTSYISQDKFKGEKRTLKAYIFKSIKEKTLLNIPCAVEQAQASASGTLGLNSSCAVSVCVCAPKLSGPHSPRL